MKVIAIQILSGNRVFWKNRSKHSKIFLYNYPIFVAAQWCFVQKLLELEFTASINIKTIAIKINAVERTFF